MSSMVVHQENDDPNTAHFKQQKEATLTAPSSQWRPPTTTSTVTLTSSTSSTSSSSSSSSSSNTTTSPVMSTPTHTHVQTPAAHTAPSSSAATATPVAAAEDPSAPKKKERSVLRSTNLRMLPMRVPIAAAAGPAATTAEEGEFKAPAPVVPSPAKVVLSSAQEPMHVEQPAQPVHVQHPPQPVHVQHLPQPMHVQQPAQPVHVQQPASVQPVQTQAQLHHQEAAVPLRQAPIPMQPQPQYQAQQQPQQLYPAQQPAQAYQAQQQQMQKQQPAQQVQQQYPTQQQQPMVHQQAVSSKVVYVNGAAYTKLEVLGKGGSSKVFRVMSETGKILALKRVNLATDEFAQASYLNEINLLKKLRGNENIVMLHDAQVLEREKLIYMVMECGEIDFANMLAKRTKTGKPMDENFTRLYWQQMLQAVQAIHEEKIVHSDLKPANFLMVEGALKLIDFGIATTIQGDATSVFRENQMGTMNYMSPEALMNDEGNHLKLGRPSDVWALGCILYQMVYGSTPFAQIVSAHHKINAIVNPNHQITFAPIRNTALLDVMKSCLQRDPAARPTIPSLLEHKFLHPY